MGKELLGRKPLPSSPLNRLFPRRGELIPPAEPLHGMSLSRGRMPVPGERNSLQAPESIWLRPKSLPLQLRSGQALSKPLAPSVVEGEVEWAALRIGCQDLPPAGPCGELPGPGQGCRRRGLSWCGGERKRRDKPPRQFGLARKHLPALSGDRQAAGRDVLPRPFLSLRIGRIGLAIDWFRRTRYLGANESRVANGHPGAGKGPTRGNGVGHWSWSQRGCWGNCIFPTKAVGSPDRGTAIQALQREADSSWTMGSYQETI